MKDPVIDSVERFDDEIHVNLQYPRSKGNAKSVVVGLLDVRAAEDIRISFDFERNGWKIEKPTVSEWEADDKVCDRCWVEVAFVDGDFVDTVRPA